MKLQQMCLLNAEWRVIMKQTAKEGSLLGMLLEFSCSNHKSIKDMVTFSIIAGKDTTFEDSLKRFGNQRVLKTAVIYGANGSGKSNLVDAIQFVKVLVINSINYQPGQGISQSIHKLSPADSDSEYRIQFVTNDIRFAFGFSIRQQLVVDEYLYYFPNGRQVKVYERDNNQFIAGDKFKGRFDACKEVIKPNRLFLSCAANFSNVEPVTQAYSFFQNDIVVYGPVNSNNWMQYSLHQIHDNPQIKKAVLSFLDSLHTGIKDINISINQKQLQYGETPPFLSDDIRAAIVANRIDQIDAKVVYDFFETDLMTEESMGVRKLFEMLCPMIDILIRGKVLICDELESSLHESLVHGLVNLFRQLAPERFAQLIFTTHDTTLLDLNLFRRDQIWFTELTRDTRATELYSLAEIKNVRKDENVEKGYISGKYGAIPMLNVELASIVSEI